jgi:hypothetical protein
MGKQVLSNANKKAIIDKELTLIYPALVINSERICSYMKDSWSQDLLTIIIEYFLKMDIDKQYTIVTTPSKKASSLEKYLTRSMALSVKSGTSPFYRVHRMKMEKNRELLPNYDYSAMIGNDDPDYFDHWEDKLQSLGPAVSTLDFYDKYLITEHYFKQQTIQDISIKTQITQQRLSADIKKALKKLKTKLE